MKALSPVVEAHVGKPGPASGAASSPTRPIDWVLSDSLLRFSLVLAFYTAASAGGNAFNRAAAASDIVWPANGLLLAFLLPIARRYWTSYLAASIVLNIVVHLFFHYSFSRSLLFSIANTIEILIAGLLISDDGIRPDLTNLRTLARFLGFGVLLAPIASTGFLEMVLTLWTYPRHPHLLLDWVVGDVMGMALMTPLILAIDKPGLARIFAPARRWETLAILFGIGALSTAVFLQTALPIDFLILPALLFAVFRLRAAGGALAIVFLAAPAVFLIVLPHGALSISGVALKHHGSFILQLFLCVCVVLVYAIEAAFGSRDKLFEEMTSASHEADAAATHDYATGLANRASFERQLARNWQSAMRDQSPLSLLIVDIDHFKLYNDHYGHLAGDECLRRIAAILAGSSKRSTDTVARYGGEEFALLLPRSNASGAMILSERIRQAVADAQLPHLPYTAGIVTVSIGIATMIPVLDEDSSHLIHCADRALYEAKKNGRNRSESWEACMEAEIDQPEPQPQPR